jgi:hypothetical protein
MSPLIGDPPGPSTTRLVSVGPIILPTLKGDITETLGDQLETIGAGVVPGERRPRALSLTIPIRGDYLHTDRRDAGLRLRRQVRALMENAPARLQGLYLTWAVDPEQNGWLLIGGADLKHATGGITFADFELELSDCYRVANIRTHRPARRLIAIDRRLATTPRDILGELFSTDFASSTATTRHHLGVAISDPVSGATRAPVTTSTITTRDGALAYADAGLDGDVVDFEQAEVDMHDAIVRLYDTHGSAIETDWEPVYGPDQPVYGVPVLDNAVCRVVPAIATGQLDVQSWTGSAWQTDATVTHPTGATTFRSRVVEWTSERAVICITSTLSAGTRGELYITLQRGWSGPRVELYATNAAGNATASLNVHARTSGDSTYQRSTGGATAIVSGTSIGTFTGLAPWVTLVGPGTDRGVALAVLQQALNLRGAILSGREGLAFESSTGYVSVTIGLGARASAATDAGVLGALNLTDARAVPDVVARG